LLPAITRFVVASRNASAREFFKNADIDDEFFLVEFQSAPTLVVPARPERAASRTRKL